MPANFTRRRDLFLDSGFGDPDAVLAEIGREVTVLGLGSVLGRAEGQPDEAAPARQPAPDDERGSAAGTELERAGDRGAQLLRAPRLDARRAALAPRLARVPPEQLRLARHVPEFVTGRSGDLATALWLARAEHGERLDVGGFLLAVLDALAAEGRERDALAYARFMLDLRSDWGRVYRDARLAHEFTRPRDPNPLVWRLLEELGARGARLRVLELGCGVGNDAFGFLHAPIVEAYTGLDVSAEALRAFEARVAREAPPVRPALVRGDFAELLGAPEPPSPDVNLVYSYSSLHYFSSGELAGIYALVRRLLLRAPRPAESYFAFGIKGAGSAWEGQGLPLYRPDVWVNWDGQSRWFPSRDALDRQLDRAGFEVRFHELHAHWGYSEKGKKDVFHYVLCSPRAEAAQVRE